MREGMLKGADVDIRKQWKTLDIAVLVRRVIDHSHIAIADSLTHDTTKMDGLFLGVLTDDFHDREAGQRSWLGGSCISPFPFPCSCEPWPAKA
jgi:hypothetical protein